MPVVAADRLRIGGKPVSTVSWTIYVLTELASGRVYVGLTRRPLAARIQSHVQQAKRKRRIRAGGLMAAIQAALSRGQKFTQAFGFEAVATADTKAEARALEREWIEQLGSRLPIGLNGMPGGSSCGGIDNARPLTVRLKGGVSHVFATVQAAVGWANGQLQAEGRPLVALGTVYARLDMKWRPDQALGLAPHRDGRRERERFTMNGKSFRTLAEASAKTGICVDTLRSRLHRQRVSGVKMDLSIDRRRALGRRGPREPRQAPTVPQMRTDRRRLLALVLPDGKRLIGGERELIGRVLANPLLDAKRVQHLSLSGIRRRLRLLDGYDRLVGGDPVRWAFGFVAMPPPSVTIGPMVH